MWCEGQHPADFLCAPARAVLDEVRARGEVGLDIPAMRFDAPVSEPLGDGLEVLRAVVAKAVVVPVFGVPRAGVLLHLRTAERELPPLLYVDDDEHVRELGKLVREAAGIAVRGAREQRRKSA